MYKLFVLDKNTWNRTFVCNLFVLDENTWNRTIVCKLFVVYRNIGQSSTVQIICMR